MYHPGIYLEALSKTTKIIKDFQSPNKNIKSGPPEYEAGVLPTAVLVL
jgi:hypothetical protein